MCWSGFLLRFLRESQPRSVIHPEVPAHPAVRLTPNRHLVGSSCVEDEHVSVTVGECALVH
jgi:hypothetical protein